jgi:hypothetical protein
LCPEISIITRSGTPALLKLVSAVRRIECVEAPLILTRLQASLKIKSAKERESKASYCLASETKNPHLDVIL